MRHGTDCEGPPYCNRVPFHWGQLASPFVYADQLGPGGQAYPRYAQTMCDCNGYCKQLGCLGECGQLGCLGDCGQLGQVPQGFPCPPGQVFDMSTMSCIDEPAFPPGYTPPGGVEDRPCTFWEQTTGQCPPSGTMPGGPELPQLPAGVVTEQQCQAREDSAYGKGKSAERGDVIKTAAISAAVSVAVGLGIGYLLGS